MISSKTIFTRLLLACLCLMSPVHAATFQEESGIVIMEAESSPAQGGWKRESSIGGYAGSGYLRWDGSNAFAVSSAGRGTTTYRFRIQRAGNYELRWRSRITRGNNRTEHNDSWVRFPTGRNIRGEQSLSGWTKVYMNTLNKWAWQSATVDNVGRRLRQYFSAGEHTLQISGRSNGHAIDRIALFHYADVNFTESRFNAMAQSSTVDGSAPEVQDDDRPVEPEPAPQPAPDPEPSPTPQPGPAPEPTPAPAPEPEPEPVEPAPPVVMEAPQVSVSGGVLSWSAVDAVVFNIHRGDGAWIESLPATRTQWQATAAGRYYVVATGPGSWESWGRSATVSVAAAEDSSVNTAELNLTAKAYSGTAIELFWSPETTDAVSFEVRREGELLVISDGRSHYDSDLQPGSEYRYTITALDTFGELAGQGAVTISTLGETVDAPGGSGSLDFRAQAYSQSALELFWNTDWLGEEAVNYRYEIHRDGQLLASVDGQSFFLEGLNADTAHEFSLVAINQLSGSVLTDAVVISTLAPDRP